MRKLNNITFDLEKLGDGENAPIVQLAAIKFDNSGNEISRFNRGVDFNSLEKYNFKIDYSTVLWWLNQNNKIIDKVFFSKNRFDLDIILVDFQKWIGEFDNYNYWSLGGFYNILYNSFKKTGIKFLIPAENQIDIRSLVFLTGKPSIKNIKDSHNAIVDCEYQVELISESLKKFNKKRI